MATPVDMGETVVRPPAEAQHMTGNEKAATLAVWGGVLMVASGVSGAYQWNQTFEIIEALLGSWRSSCRSRTSCSSESAPSGARS